MLEGIRPRSSELSHEIYLIDENEPPSGLQNCGFGSSLNTFLRVARKRLILGNAERVLARSFAALARALRLGEPDLPDDELTGGLKGN